MAIPKLTPEQIIEAIPTTGGLPVAIAAKLNVSAQTIRNYAKKYKTVADAIEHERDNTTDFVENQLLKAIKAGNITAIIFYLKTQAKDRGYVERSEVTGKNGGPVEAAAQVVVYIPDNGRDGYPAAAGATDGLPG